jgi:NAD(P)-dependent dehydrogenase (short-subunit alcohol dehydrogenase family)
MPELAVGNREFVTLRALELAPHAIRIMAIAPGWLARDA